MQRSFSITYDYLCPFARNANETLVEMLQGGAAYSVNFVPFSLAQSNTEDGEIPQWDRPLDEVGGGVLALLWSIAVRDGYPEFFLAFHAAVFSARHDEGSDIGDEGVLGRVALSVGLDAESIRSHVATGAPAGTLAVEHMELVEDHETFGVPTFIEGDEAVFVRFMERHTPDDVERALDMLGWTNLNEFKRTTIPR